MKLMYKEFAIVGQHDLCMYTTERWILLRYSMRQLRDLYSGQKEKLEKQLELIKR